MAAVIANSTASFRYQGKPNADSRAHAVATSCVVLFAHEPAFGDAAAGPSCRTLWDGST
jgi:hypothetical protein